jgi:hypothetical protein
MCAVCSTYSIPNMDGYVPAQESWYRASRLQSGQAVHSPTDKCCQVAREKIKLVFRVHLTTHFPWMFLIYILL